MKNYWKWLIGGGLAFWAYKAYAQTTENPGNITVAISFKPGTISLPAVNDAMNALGGMRQVCTGAPLIGTLVSGPSIQGNDLVAVLEATWNHTTLGPVREAVRVCILNHLQAMNANIVGFRADRIS